MHIRLERSDGILCRVPETDLPSISEQVILGPFEWVQLTYSELRVSPDGDVIAYSDDGDWYVRAGENVTHNAYISLHLSVKDVEHPFSDVVIY